MGWGLARDVGAATGRCVLGAACAATSITVRGAPPGSISVALGIFLLTVAAMMLVLCVGSLQSKPLFGVLLLIGAARASGPTGGVAGGLVWLVGQVAGSTVLLRGREDRGRGGSPGLSSPVVAA